MAAIASFRFPVSGQLIRGVRRLHPSVPLWDLALVLKALSLPQFEPLESIAVKELSLKTARLLALASAKHIGDLDVFSVNKDC